MLLGEYRHTLDTKGRVSIPAKFREQLGENFVVTRGLDGCLFVYSAEEWNKFEDKLQMLPLTSKEARKFSRYFLAGAARCEADKLGKILLPAHLRAAAGLEKAVVLIGVGNRVEIWDQDRWDEFSTYDDVDEIAEKMEGLGI